MRSGHWAILALGSATLAGCGGSQTVLGSNSNVDIFVENTPARALELIVAPQQGRETNTQACTAHSDGFGCQRIIDDLFITYRFRTVAEASENPYYVYLKNTGDQTVRTVLELQIDGNPKFDVLITAPPKTTIFVAKVFRNNALNQFGG